MKKGDNNPLPPSEISEKGLNEIRNSGQGHAWNDFERFWILCIFSVFVIYFFNMTNSKPVKPEKRACCFFQRSKEGGSKGGQRGKLCSAPQPFLENRMSGIELVVVAASGKGKQTAEPAVRKEVKGVSLGPEKAQRWDPGGQTGLFLSLYSSFYPWCKIQENSLNRW